ncbi:malonate decarboxylase holo-ACP synthase [Gordonia sp. NPDC003424]
MDALTPHPHDLLRLMSATALHCDDPTRTARARAAATIGPDPWVVVRRADAGPGRVAVGVRGATRAERYAAVVPVGAVTEVVAPWAIATTPAPDRRHLPALRTLDRLRSSGALQGLAERWGPGGSVGFELVTGAPAVAEGSDLDLVVDAPTPLSRDAAHDCLAVLDGCGARVDLQVATPLGAFALAEWLRQDGGPVALRTGTGPVLTSRPWG